MSIDYASKLGWQKGDLPDGVLGLIVMRKFVAACNVMAANFTQLAREANQVAQTVEPQDMSEYLQQIPFYRHVMTELEHALEEEASFDRYKLNAQTLYEGVRHSNAQSLLDLIFAMWVVDGAELPDGLIELVQAVEKGEEEGILDNLTGDEEE